LIGVDAAVELVINGDKNADADHGDAKAFQHDESVSRIPIELEYFESRSWLRLP
jgi:hypothetical protein